jgi:hypothetical protein
MSEDKKYKVINVHMALWNCRGECHKNLEDALNEGWRIDRLDKGENGEIYILKQSAD